MKEKNELARIWAEAKPSVRIGKGGVNSGVIEEVKRQLKKQPLIKVRVLRAALASEVFDEMILKLATETRSKVCGRRGSVVVLARKGWSGH